MIEVKKNEMFKIKHFFDTMNDSVILSCIQGHMGKAWTDNISEPTGALILAGDFCFIAGDEESEQFVELITRILDLADINFAFVIPENKKLGDLIEKIYKENCKKIQRYSIRKNKDFDLVKLQNIVDTLPSEYTLCPIDDKWYSKALEEEWSESFASNFLSYEDFNRRGIGRVIIHNGMIVSGASSYTVYNDGIEVEIATREAYRKKGLAGISGAALILACSKKGLTPSWDAANMISVRLAEKLGYEYIGPYDTYAIRKS